jgi:hypothetical protein
MNPRAYLPKQNQKANEEIKNRKKWWKEINSKVREISYLTMRFYCPRNESRISLSLSLVAAA